MINGKRRFHSTIAALYGAASVILGVHAASADGSMQGMPHGHSPSAGFPFGAPGDRTNVDHTIRIVMGDMSFEPAAVTIEAGETVRFIVTNRSEIDHDFTLGDAATQGAHRAEMAEMMDMSAMTHVDDPNAILVRTGETRELIWTFGEAGRLEFGCNVPGHYEAGMKGTIDVLSKLSVR